MTVNKAQFGLEKPPRAKSRDLTDRYPDQAIGQMGSVTDIANLFKVGTTAVSNWINRHDNFPQPKSVVGYTGTRQTGIWDMDEVRGWYEQRGGKKAPTDQAAGMEY